MLVFSKSILKIGVVVREERPHVILKLIFNVPLTSGNGEEIVSNYGPLVQGADVPHQKAPAQSHHHQNHQVVHHHQVMEVQKEEMEVGKEDPQEVETVEVKLEVEMVEVPLEVEMVDQQEEMEVQHNQLKNIIIIKLNHHTKNLKLHIHQNQQVPQRNLMLRNHTLRNHMLRNPKTINIKINHQKNTNKKESK